ASDVHKAYRVARGIFAAEIDFFPAVREKRQRRLGLAVAELARRSVLRACGLRARARPIRANLPRQPRPQRQFYRAGAELGARPQRPSRPGLSAADRGPSLCPAALLEAAKISGAATAT